MTKTTATGTITIGKIRTARKEAIPNRSANLNQDTVELEAQPIKNRSLAVA
jgi:hypothetical protein